MRRLLFAVMILMGCMEMAAQQDVQSSKTNTREYDVMLHEALLQRQKGHHDASFDLLCRCRELRPDASEVHYFIGQYYEGLGQKEQALASYQRASQLEPENITYLERLAGSYVDSNQYAEAIDVVERMYEANKGRDELLESLYALYWQQKDFEKAVDVLNRMELADGPTERTTLMKCRLYIEMEDSDRAIAEMKSLSDHYPNDPTYRTLYANTLLVTDHEDEAYDVLMQVMGEDATNLRAQQVLRNYYIRQGDEISADSVNHAILLNPKASTEDRVEQMRRIIMESEQTDGDSTVVLSLFQELLNLPEPDPDIAEMKAVYMQLKEMPHDSIAHAFEYVLQLAPDQASSRLRLVQQAWEDQDDDRIISLCQAARQYNPEEMAFYYYQGMAYYRQEDTDHALEAFKNGISVITEDSNPEIVSDFYAVMGDLLHQKGLQAEAYAAYDSCLVWKEDNIGCLNNYAYYLSLTGDRLAEAEQMSYKTVKAEPNNATYLDTYAWILFMQQRYAEAKVYIDQALQNDSLPGAVIHEHAGDIYALSGDIDGAMAYWEQALSEDPDNKLLRKKTKRKKYFKK